jgi:hypothetical protein
MFFFMAFLLRLDEQHRNPDCLTHMTDAEAFGKVYKSGPGARVRRMPLIPEKLLAAMKKA